MDPQPDSQGDERQRRVRVPATRKHRAPGHEQIRRPVDPTVLVHDAPLRPDTQRGHRRRRRLARTRHRILAGVNLSFGITIGTMAFGHALAATIEPASGTLVGSPRSAGRIDLRKKTSTPFSDISMPRWLILAVLLSAITVSGYHRARARLLGGTVARLSEGRLFLALRGLMALAVFGGILAHAVTPEWMAWASFDVPQTLRWLGLGLGVLTVPAVHWVLSVLGVNVTETVLTKERHELVTTGPYRWVRHPLYTTGLMLLLALGLMAGSWFVLLATVLAFVLLRVLVIPREEQALLAKFGDRYHAYTSRTGRLVPRMGSGSARGSA